MHRNSPLFKPAIFANSYMAARSQPVRASLGFAATIRLYVDELFRFKTTLQGKVAGDCPTWQESQEEFTPPPPNYGDL
jgi:hypothetical protein